MGAKLFWNHNLRISIASYMIIQKNRKGLFFGKTCFRNLWFEVFCNSIIIGIVEFKAPIPAVLFNFRLEIPVKSIIKFELPVCLTFIKIDIFRQIELLIVF